MAAEEPDPFGSLSKSKWAAASKRGKPKRGALKPPAAPAAKVPEPPASRPAPPVGEAGLAKVAAKTAADVCQRFEIGKEAKALLRDGMTPRQYLDLLVE